MNAVSSASNAGTGILAALPANKPTVPAQAQTGFNNLISALLGPQSQAPSEDATAVADDSQDSGNPPVQVRSSAEIADAMIRSMLGSPLASGNLYSDRTAAAPTAALATTVTKTRSTKDDSPSTGTPAQPAADPAGLVPSAPVPVAPLPVTNVQVPLTPVLTPPDAALTSAAEQPGQAPTSFGQGRKSGNTPGNASGNNTSGGSQKFQDSAVVSSPELRPTTAKADVAFALRLTPVEAREETETTAPLPATSQTKVAPTAAPATTAPQAGAAAAPTPVAVPTQVAAPTTPVIENAPTTPSENASAQADSDSQSKDNSSANTPHPAITEAKPRQQDQNSEAAPAAAAPAASADRGGDSSRALPNSQAAPALARAVDQAPAEPVRTAEQALRTSETAPAESTPKSGIAQQFAVRISGPDSPAVDLHVSGRAGQVQVTVRTPDAGLQTSLRQDLGTLVNTLERSGYRAESLPLRESVSSAAGLTAVASQSGGASFMDARNHFQNGGQNGGQNGRGGSQQESSQGQQNNSGGQQQKRNRPQLNWIDTLEKAQ